MIAEESFGTLSCDAGSGRLGETLQHAAVGDDAAMLLGAVSDIPSIIVAIFGQCGSQGWLEFAAPWVQQPAIATAGEASRLSNKERATSLERIFTVNIDSILHNVNLDGCDLNHTRMSHRSHLVITSAKHRKDAL
jgi:hypothetical protein